MPLIVDKEQVKQEILQALQQCLEEKPLMKVSMRDIAAKANIAHSKINYYFESKDKLLLAYIDFFATTYKNELELWYKNYKQNSDNESSVTVVKRFIKEMIWVNHQNQSWAFTQISTVSQYNSEIKSAIQTVYHQWRKSIKLVLEEIYQTNDKNMVHKAEAILIIVDGLLILSLCDEIDEPRIDAILENISL